MACCLDLINGFQLSIFMFCMRCITSRRCRHTQGQGVPVLGAGEGGGGGERVPPGSSRRELHGGDDDVAQHEAQVLAGHVRQAPRQGRHPPRQVPRQLPRQQPHRQPQDLIPQLPTLHPPLLPRHPPPPTCTPCHAGLTTKPCTSVRQQVQGCKCACRASRLHQLCRFLATSESHGSGDHSPFVSSHQAPMVVRPRLLLIPLGYTSVRWGEGAKRRTRGGAE